MRPKHTSKLPFLALTGALVLLAGAHAFASDPLGLMPEAASAEAEEIDLLIYVILWITGITMVVVEGLLLWFVIRYRDKPGAKAKHTHGNHVVEMIWTIGPSLILVFIALYQIPLWNKLKANVPEDNADAVKIQIFAKQFEWNFRYPGADGEFGTEDDKLTKAELVIPVDRPLNAQMRSMDVLHSFFLPNFRVKWDAVPGVEQNIWVRPNKLSADRALLKDRDGNDVEVNYWDVVCAELCGDNHTEMAAQLYVVENAEYEKWLAGEETSISVQLFPYYDDDAIWSRWSWQDNRNSVPGPANWDRNPFGEDVTSGAEGDDEEDDL